MNGTKTSEQNHEILSTLSIEVHNLSAIFKEFSVNTNTRISGIETVLNTRGKIGAAQVSVVLGCLIVLAQFMQFYVASQIATLKPSVEHHTEDLTRIDHKAETLALAVLEKEKLITEQRIEFERLGSQVKQSMTDIDYMKRAGTPESNMRLTVLEERTHRLIIDADKLRQEGSPFTDRRLNIIEHELKLTRP